MTSIAEDAADEVKVFRRDDAEEDLDTPASSQQLSDDKKDVALETDMEPQNVAAANPFGQFTLQPAPFSTMSMSPGHLFLFQQQLQQKLQSPNVFAAQFSPSFAAFSPSYLLPLQYTQPMMNNLLQNMRNSPMTNMTNNLANMQFNNAFPPRFPPNSPLIATPKRERIHREKKEKNRIKKPCNAFMIFMRENRIAVAKENKCKQSSELNKELGQRWQSLTKEEQEKYFDMAKNEREEHARLYPGWSARDNYAINKKKRRNRRERSYDPANENNEQKKCRARFGVDNQEKWCKHCRRKKKCLNVMESEVSSSTNPPTPTNFMNNLFAPHQPL